MKIPVLVAGLLLAAASHAACPGDCNGNGRIDASELQSARDAVLGRAVACGALGGSKVDDLVAALGAAYRGCRLSECAFSAGALPADTLEPGSPLGAQIPIDHVVWVMQENRSFDHYLGSLDREDVDGLRLGLTNPSPDGPPVEPFHEADLCTDDVDHSWNATHRAYDGGQMDGFVAANEPGGERAMAFYDAGDIPFYHAIANAFAMSDRNFCSLLGPTFPNRYFLYCGTAFGHVDNGVSLLGWTQRTILQEMTEHGLSWRIYSPDVAFANVFRSVRGSPNLRSLDDWFTDAANGTLPALAIIDPAYTGVASNPTDEHPPSDIQAGQAHVAAIVNALMASPQWGSSALFWTYDEHGGYYDHVSPPPACEPDAIQPDLGSGDEPGAYDRLGIRVPLVVVSPWAKPGCVSHRATDHASLLRFLEARFALPALTARDANALALLDLFDFGEPSLLQPPSLPPAIIEPNRGCP